MSRATQYKQLIPGTTGWSVSDLDNPRTERDWEAGHFQILEGILTTMPPALWDASSALHRLVRIIENHLESQGLPPDIAFEVDVIVGEYRVPKADAVYMSPQDKARQLKNRRGPKRKGIKYGRLNVPPTLVIENISRGHESEDRVLKRRFYAEASIPNYWILDVYQRSLECLALKKGKYVIDQLGRGKAQVTPKCFPGLTIDLKQVWED